MDMGRAVHDVAVPGQGIFPGDETLMAAEFHGDLVILSPQDEAAQFRIFFDNLPAKLSIPMGRERRIEFPA